MTEVLPDLLLTPVEARVLGCLIEKKELTPDVYPMTLNALQAAANQKTSREPMMALEPVEIARALGTLEQKGLVRRAFASRVERYEHRAGQQLGLAQGQSVLLALLMLRGPQTLNELMTRTERMANFASVDALREQLDLLIGKATPLVKEIGRAPGQREDRYAHLLSGDVQVAVAAVSAMPARAPSVTAVSELEERISRLEEQVAALQEQIKVLTGD